MNTTRRARLAWGAAMGAVGIVLLSACNPISQTPYTPQPQPEQAPTWSTAKLIYDGPADAWIEVGLSGISGYEATTQTAIQVPDPAEQGKPRDCKSGTVRGAPVSCHDYPEFPYTDLHQADLDPAGSYWPTVLVHPGEHFQVMIKCRQGDKPALCPPTMKVEARSVDNAGKLIGDIRGPDAGQTGP
jgi:hypothetical protein